MNYKTFRRRALQIAIGFLVLTALVAIVSVFMDDFGHVYTKILATCFTISVACLCIIASTAFIEQRQQVALGSVGILLSLVAAGLIISGLWAELRFDWYWKTSACLTVCAVASAHCFLLLIPQLDRRQQWLRWTASLSIGLLAVQSLISICLQLKTNLHSQLIGVVSILVGLQTVLIPIFMKMRKGETSPTLKLQLTQVEGNRYRDVSGREYLLEEPPQDNHESADDDPHP